MMVAEVRARTVWVAKRLGRVPLSTPETIQGLWKWAWICAEPLRTKLGALEPRRHLCGHMGAPESHLRDGAPRPGRLAHPGVGGRNRLCRGAGEMERARGA